MKQRQYTGLQREIMNVLDRIESHLYGYDKKQIFEEIKKIKKDFGIEPPLLTLRDYIKANCRGSYHSFHFSLNGQKIVIDSLGNFLNDEWCHLFAETNRYYVVKDETKDNGGNCENYHCDHYLTLEPKED